MLLRTLCLCFFAGVCLGQVEFQRGQKWQIVLTGTPDVSKMPLPPTDAPVWDVDLFDTEASSIKTLKAAGKIVICYFSAGTWEDWRDDAKEFPNADIGKVLPEWPNEKWIRTGSQKVRDIMSKRIKIAADKGCDAIDPDNTDGYQNDNGLNLRNTDLIDYMRWLQKTAAGYNMKIGLKNSLDILPTIGPIMDFAVNEQCAQLSECTAYNDFLASGKPVFHIEYPTPLNPSQANSTYCNGPGTDGMSTILKDMQLTGIAVYCDGSQVNTPTKGGTSPPRPSNPPRPTSRPPIPPRPSSTSRATPTTTPRPPSTTLRPPPSTTIRSTTRPSSTPPGNPGGGCKQKHWDQCGGNDWKGCTTCESPYTCKAVSAPWYYQCL
ncbi:carbohydrate-binding module family 1 protein [Aaosphaeria arxii CBS 175.79]|uniref:alpha-galactosidase n=1 Tax=Aaosphaeria arxii CBS 175.79 TaxID=1450172 RepID=A0A6A5XKE3_9PLEO|nr:carbohydrate-binding module family 1 protein [Aaosphaeria arxii CBS 175.79]KAF2013349.1 carbohydrate-binding module family 1 protein [Aaosphaeria arxii CBS 175.79]